ncbi:SDR family NAD(P)-dependent oxidoreductase [Phenylobacterium sp. LjRoot225]|uniref:SDR family NAD(P)-dependent oxidoreductase n=1 Tax=Phenylobacterium sp. LjRoot225 TaxID=3342285 RepID=UPI003ECF5F52
MAEALRPLAVVTGASSGIGYELAKLAAENGHDLVLAADRPEIVEAAQALRQLGGWVDHIQVDLATRDGEEKLIALIGDRPVDLLMANAGHGLGRGFLDQQLNEWRHVIDTNITGTLYLVHRLGQKMRERDRGRILFVGSIAALMPGISQAVYNASKAFIDSFSLALRRELKDTGITVTCLLPGATDTDFFERAGISDSKVRTSRKDDPAMVAKVGFEAMMRGEGDVVAGFKNRFRAAVIPQSSFAEMYRGMAEPGAGR